MRRQPSNVLRRQLSPAREQLPGRYSNQEFLNCGITFGHPGLHKAGVLLPERGRSIFIASHPMLSFLPRPRQISAHSRDYRKIAIARRGYTEAKTMFGKHCAANPCHTHLSDENKCLNVKTSGYFENPLGIGGCQRKNGNAIQRAAGRTTPRVESQPLVGLYPIRLLNAAGTLPETAVSVPRLKQTTFLRLPLRSPSSTPRRCTRD